MSDSSGDRARPAYYNYHPFGMEQEQNCWTDPAYKARFGFQGMERGHMAGESGNSYSTQFRQYDVRLGRWMSPDPVFQPWQSPYNGFDGNPVSLVDPLGLSVGGAVLMAGPLAGSLISYPNIPHENQWKGPHKRLQDYKGSPYFRSRKVYVTAEFPSEPPRGLCPHCSEQSEYWTDPSNYDVRKDDLFKYKRQRYEDALTYDWQDGLPSYDEVNTIYHPSYPTEYQIDLYFNDSKEADGNPILQYAVYNRIGENGRLVPVLIVNATHYQRSLKYNEAALNFISAFSGNVWREWEYDYFGEPSLANALKSWKDPVTVATSLLETGTIVAHTAPRSVQTSRRSRNITTPGNSTKWSAKHKARYRETLKTGDMYHTFNRIIDNHSDRAIVTTFKGGDGRMNTLYQVYGSLNGQSGVFEWQVRNGWIVHRRFVRRGEATGRPNGRNPHGYLGR